MTGSAVRIDHLTPSGLSSHSPPLSLFPAVPPWTGRSGPGAGPFASAAVRPRASEILGGAFLCRAGIGSAGAPMPLPQERT
jgi:hypothetical protein